MENFQILTCTKTHSEGGKGWEQKGFDTSTSRSAVKILHGPEKALSPPHIRLAMEILASFVSRLTSPKLHLAKFKTLVEKIIN